MKSELTAQINFFSEMAEHQISAREFFGNVLLDAIERNFKFEKTLIHFFDTEGNFLSWVSSQDGGHKKSSIYKKFILNDIIRYIIFQEALKDKLTYFDVIPRLYKSTDLINYYNYDESNYVQFIEENFNAHYSVTMPFGINAYIQVTFFKSLDEGDFTEEELERLKKIYVYIANSYKSFKKYEQAKIVANIQNEIIASGEKAYLITDDFMHILSYNSVAQNYLKDIFGNTVLEQINSETPAYWLPFLLGEEKGNIAQEVRTRIIHNCIFKIYTYDQTYSNGIIDRYHWITISQKNTSSDDENIKSGNSLTQSEEKIVELLYRGLTYKEISEELTISYHTVKKHVQNIYSKCGVNSRFKLYKWVEKK